MSGKTLGILGLLTVVLVGLAIALTSRQPPAIQGANQPLFPGFEKRINETGQISVTTPENKVTVVRENNQWRVREKGDYPAAVDQVRQLLLGVTGLTRIEPKTQNPSLYGEIAVDDVTNKDSKAKLIEIQDDHGTTIAKVLLGKERPPAAGATANDYFVRVPGEAQSWLVSGNLTVDPDPKRWLDTQLLDIDKKRIHQVTIKHAAGDTVTVTRDTPDATDFHLTATPKHATVKSAFTVNEIANTMGRLTLDDVFKSGDVQTAAKPDFTAAMETFDGLRVTLTASADAKDAKKRYVTLAAAYDPSLVIPAKADTKDKSKDKPAAKTPDQVKQEAQDLEAGFKPWVYALPPFQIANLDKKMSDLVTPGKPAAAKSAKKK
jgi:hypothetical protein